MFHAFVVFTLNIVLKVGNPVSLGIQSPLCLRPCTRLPEFLNARFSCAADKQDQGNISNDMNRMEGLPQRQRS
jgi:hypothetical protein